MYGPLEFTYDANGTLTADVSGAPNAAGPIRNFEYDALGGLRKVEVVGGAASTTIYYDLDPQGRRVRRTEGSSDRRWIYQDALNPVAELDAQNRLVARYIYLTSSHSPDIVVRFNPTTGIETGRYRLVHDLRGSVRLALDMTTGAVAQRISYGPFGETTYEIGSDSLHPFAYAGGMYDAATQLYRFGARDYDPRIGRWTAKDPIRWEGGQWNLYEYVGGDAVNGVDPSGLQSSGDVSPGREPGVWVCREPLALGAHHYWTVICSGSEPDDCRDYSWGPSAGWLPRREDGRGESPGAQCRRVPDVDPECVERQQRTRLTGSYFPFTNDCRRQTEEPLNECGATPGWPGQWFR